MLTHHDVTVKDAGEIFEQCKDLPVKFWGFKNVGLPKDEMKKVAGAMKAAGKTTFLEVVTYDEASCLDGAQTAIDCGFDYLMGTVYYDSVAKLLKENGMAYLPFVGKVSGSPSILEGTNEEIIQNAKDQPDMPRPYKCPRWLGYIGIPFCLIVAFCSLYSAVTAGTLFYIAVAFFVIAMIYYAAVCKKKNGTFLVEPEDQ